MGDFNKALQFLFENEGGYTGQPEPTNYGVTLSALRRAGEIEVDGAFCGDIDQDGDVDADDIRAMTRKDAVRYYRRQWWDRYGYEAIDDDDAAAKIFDLAVNMGPSAAHRLVQRAVNHLYGYVLIEDGILGPKTLARINDAPAFLLLGELRAQAWRYYQHILANNPKLEVYRNGWRNRAYK